MSVNWATKGHGIWGLILVMPANYLFLYSKIIVLLHRNRLGDYPISLAAITTTTSIKTYLQLQFILKEQSQRTF
jgi:hypothetical protein